MSSFKSLIWDSLVKAALVKLFVAFPFLNIWPLSWFIKYFSEKYSDQLYVMIEKFVDVSAIVLKNETAKNEYNVQSVKLLIIAREKGIDSKEFKDAREIAKTKLAAFIQFKR